jgi:glycosyltransferase involved in cell wall biosynthesis
LKLLIACSWLDVKSKRGWFFVEHAQYLLEEYPNLEISFLRFESQNLLDYIITVIRNKKRRELIENKFMLYTFFVPKLNLENYVFKRIAKFFLYRQYRQIQQEFDVIHAQSLFDAGIYTHWFSVRFKLRAFLTEHNQLNFLDSRFNRRTIKNALNNFEKRILVSKDLIRQFSSCGFFNNFEIIRNPIDTVFYNAELENKALENENKANLNTVILLHTGAFTPIKNQILLLDFLKRLDLDGLTFQLNWVGYNSWGGENIDIINAEIDKRVFSNNIAIKLFPRLSKLEMQEIYRKADLAISTSNCETYGISSVEAMSMGIPLLSTDNGGVREFATNENAIIVPICDLEELYKGFYEWLERRDEFNRDEISQNIKLLHAPKRFAIDIMNIYKN